MITEMNFEPLANKTIDYDRNDGKITLQRIIKYVQLLFIK